MSDLAKRHRDYKRKESRFNKDGEFDVELTTEGREAATQFDAPKERKFKARNVITMHLNHLNLPRFNAHAMVQIFACVIDHANINTGRCDASQGTIAIETNYHRNTVKKWLDWIAANTPYLTIEQRRGKLGKFRTSAYHIHWANLETDWEAIQDFIKQGKAEARKQ